MALRLLGVILLVTIPAGALRAEDARFYPLIPYFPTVADIDDIRATLANPAFLGTHSGWNTYGSWVRRGDLEDPGQQDDHFTLLMGYGSFALGYQEAETSSVARGSRRVFMAKGFKLSNSLRLGARMHWDHQSGLSRSDVWSFDVAASIRPSPFVSVGFTASDLNGPTFRSGNDPIHVSPSFAVGVAVRPRWEKLTISTDFVYTSRKDPTEGRYVGLATINYEPVPGVTIFAGYHTDQRMMLGLKLGATRQLGLGATGIYDHHSDWYAAGVEYLASSKMRRTILDRKGIFTRYQAGGQIVDAPPYKALVASSTRQSLQTILKDLRRLNEDASVKGVVLVIEPLWAGPLDGFGADLEEIRRAILGLRQNGKVFVAYLRDRVRIPEYYLASACDEVIMPATGAMDDLDQGTATDSTGGMIRRLRPEDGLLDRPLADLNAAFRSMRAQAYQLFLEEAAESRRTTPEEMRARLTPPHCVATEAQRRGLIDYVGSMGLARDRLFTLADEPRRHLSRARDQQDAGLRPLQRVGFHDSSWDPRVRVAIVEVEGPMVTGSTPSDWLTGECETGSDDLTDLIRRVRLDSRVSGLVLRLNSPGGEVAASEEVLQELRLMQFYNKPLVVSVGNCATGGAYWVGASGDRILVGRTSVMGGIGPLSQRPLERRRRDRLGALKLMSGGDASSALKQEPALPARDDEAARELIASYRDLFVERVAAARGLTQEQVIELADGRVLSGRDAIDAGLGDTVGGLEAAIETVRTLAKVPPYRRVDTVIYKKKRGFWMELVTRSLEVLLSND